MSALRRKIFVGCRELRLDDDTRRELQLQVTGKASLSDMTEPELKKVVKELEKRGFKPVSKGRKYRPAPRADLRLCHKLWGLLGEAGALDQPGRAGLNAFVRKQFGDAWSSVPADIDMLRDAEQINAIVQALMAMCRRHNVPGYDEGRMRR
ncbi:gp16 family protein [Tropicimonas sp. S265A]|uniref:gp16 family protein n=1 Tax=Tropicimonas sp. S265A TaxID=3415134 RepID=UPI003C7EACF4